jgi:hypothetical protein
VGFDELKLPPAMPAIDDALLAQDSDVDVLMMLEVDQ